MKPTLLLCAICAAGCGRSQWLVQVSTDTNTPTWGNRLLVEVLDDAGSVMGRLDREVTDADFPVSFGVVPPPAGGPPRVRGRLYHSTLVDADGLPAGNQLIDVVGILPPLFSGGIDTPALLMLGNGCWGQPADVPNHQACNYITGFQAEDVLGRYSISRSDPNDETYLPGYIAQFAVACPSALDGMVCVEAVPILMGANDSAGVDTDYPTSPLVLQQPPQSQLLDVDEFSVGKARTLVAAGKLPLSEILQRGDDGVPETCTFLGVKVASNDEMPLNCISLKGAVAACAAQSKTLPSETLWELAARNGTRETRYPWGQDPPDCQQAVVSADATCPRTGPARLDPNTPDVTDAGIRNLGGNLSEWVDGVYAPYSDPCWQVETFNAEYCTEAYFYANLTAPFPHRGGSWDRRASSAAGFARFASPDGAPSPSIGFRCAAASSL